MNISRKQNLINLTDALDLQDNWNGYGAKAINRRLIGKCMDIVCNLDIQPYIFPTGRDSIQLEYELNNSNYLEFEVFVDRIEIMFTKGSAESTVNFKLDTLSYNTMNLIIDKFYKQELTVLYTEWSKSIFSNS